MANKNRLFLSVMKICTLIVTLLFFTTNSICLAVSDEDKITSFIEARGAWTQAVDDFAQGKKQSVADVLAKGDAAFSAWQNLPPESKKNRLDELYRQWFQVAIACAEHGQYEQALSFYNREMTLRYLGGNLLRGKTPAFFMDAITLEAKILGHLGRNYYPASIDHFLMPVNVKRNGLDEFVAMESTTADEVGGVDIPPLPDKEQRKIIYLLAADEKGNYRVVDSVQLIGLPDKKTVMGINESDYPQPRLALGGITHRVELKNGIPVKYTSLPKPFIKFNITANGFTEITPEN